MDSIKLWARNGEAVRQAIELGEIAHIETASEELTTFPRMGLSQNRSRSLLTG
jgi:hypothetical protein